MSAIPDPAKSFREPASENATRDEPGKGGGDRDQSGRFLAGNRSSPGRRGGTRVRLSQKFFEALSADFEEHGVEAIARMRFLRPDVYVSVIAKLMPQKIEISTPTDGLTDERLEQLLSYAEARVAEMQTIEGEVIEVTPKALSAPAPFSVAPPTEAEQRAEAVRRDLLDQSDAANAAAPKLPSQALPHPVGRVVEPIDREVTRRNLAKLHADIEPVDPESLF